MEPVLTENDNVESPEEEYDPSVADPSLLADKFPEWFRTNPSTTAMVAVLVFTFLLFNLRPLWHTDVWGHLSYGRHIWNAGELPTTEPLMPLAAGTSFVDTAWLSQVLGYGAYQVAGKAALASGFGALVALALGLLLFRVQRRTESVFFAITAFGLTLWMNWSQLAIIRPQAVGFVMFCGLLCFLMRRKWSTASWLLVPGMFALWANMHGSFIVGLGLMGCFLVGRAGDVLRRTGRPAALIRDARVRRLLLLTQLSAVATLINPYGLGLYASVLTFGSHPNLSSIIEWQALSINMAQGRAAAIVALMLFVIYRVSPRRVAFAELLTLAIFGAAALYTSRMIIWWAPVAAVLFSIHAAAAWRQWCNSRIESEYEPREPASMWTIVSMGLVLVSLQLSHLGAVAMAAATGKNAAERAEKVVVNPMTPVGAAEFLHEHPPTGLVFNTYEFGDYLTWAGPKDLKLFVNSHVHLTPPDIWKAYMGIIEQRGNWIGRFDRYGVNVVILDKRYRPEMIESLSKNEAWRLRYTDDRSAVFYRRKPMTITDTSQ